MQTTTRPAAPAPSGAALRNWVRELVEEESLPRGRALVLSAGMAEEAVALLALRFPVRVVDASRPALSGLEKEAPRGADLQTIHGDFLALSPGVFGTVDCVVEHAYLPTLEPIRRAAWAHKIARVLPLGGVLAGLFRVGRAPDGPPYLVPEDELRKLLERHFVLESLEPWEPRVPGRPGVLRGVFRRK